MISTLHDTAITYRRRASGALLASAAVAALVLTIPAQAETDPAADQSIQRPLPAYPAHHELTGWAALPSTVRISGPTSGQFTTPANGVVPPYADAQPIPGWSGLLDNGDGTFTALPDNGFGSKGNSGDFLLGTYEVRPRFKTKADGTTAPGDVRILGFTTFNDRLNVLRNGKGVDLTITADLENYASGDGGGTDSGIKVDRRIKQERLLTGYDFDVESITRADDGTLWVGEEFGPYVLHFSASGTLLDEPIPHPFLKSPQHPDVLAGQETANLASSRGFESLVFDNRSRFLYAVPQAAPTVDEVKPVPGDDSVVDVYQIDAQQKRYTGRSFKYRKDGSAIDNQTVIGDITNVVGDVFVVIEHDNFYGADARLKKMYVVDLNVTDEDGALVKHLLVDLLHVEDPRDLAGDLPEVPPRKFDFPFNSVGSVVSLDRKTLGVAIDTNYPGDAGRVAGRPDDTEIIKLRFEHEIADYAPVPDDPRDDDFSDASLWPLYQSNDTPTQGTAIYGDEMFVLNHPGDAKVFDLESGDAIQLGEFRLGSYNDGVPDSRFANHANSAHFSEQHYRGNELPLLYVTTGNSGETAEDGYIGRTAVENITKSIVDGDLTYSSELLQTIVYNNAGIEKTQWETPAWGWPATFVDSKRGWYYLFSARYRTTIAFEQYYHRNAYIITKFRLPEIGKPGEKVVLGPDDIVDQFTTPYDIYHTQGGTFYDGKIIYAYGNGKNAEGIYPNGLRVFDLKAEAITRRVDLSRAAFANQELESAAVYDGALLVSTHDGDVYRFEDVDRLTTPYAVPAQCESSPC